MRVVLAVRGAHRSNLLAACNPLTAPHQNRIKMTVEGIDMFDASVFPEGVSNNHHISPSPMNVACKHHDPIPNTLDRVAQVRGSPANSIPVLAHMATGGEPARFVIAFAFRLTDREIKTIR